MDIARRHGLIVVEDAAQALMSRYKGRPLGGFGHLATFSFHETKNVISGEGGALVINDARFVERAEIIWEKGTNRSQFSRGQVDKYTWIDIGSSFLPGELTAAFLWAQLEEAEHITARAARGLEPLPNGLALRSRPSACAVPVMSRRLRSQRAPVLPAAAVAGASERHPGRPQRPRRQRGVPLRAAALVAGRAALRPACRFDERHRRLQRPPDSTAAVDRDADEARRR